MEYLKWHYLVGPLRILQLWDNFFRFIPYYFSLGELARSLFAPWKRQTLNKGRGFDLEEFINVVSFNLISRLIGALVRIIIIFAGILAYIFLALLLPPVFFVWFIIPGLTYPLYLKLRKKDKIPTEVFPQDKAFPNEILKEFLKTKQGKFFQDRLNLGDFTDLTNLGETPIGITADDKTSWSEMIYFLADKWSPLNQLLKDNQLSKQDIQNVSIWYEDWDKDRRENTELWRPENFIKIRPLGRDLIYGYTVNLDKFATDLTLPLPYSHHLVGRQKEAKLIEQILSRSSGNNLLLMGEPGVGRTTIILNFARMVAEGRVDPLLARKRVLELNLNQVIAEAKTPQEAKAITEQILNEAIIAGNIILVIKHFDLYLANGEGRINLTDIFLKPAASDSLQIIGITTPTDYQKYLYPNQEIKKYFEKVEVSEPTKEEAYLILEKVAPVFEQNTKTYVTYPALKETIEKSGQYIVDLPFPEKAIDLLDEVCVEVSQQKQTLVTITDVDRVLSQKTKIPVGEITKSESEKLMALEGILHQRVIAQDEAVTQIAMAMRRARTGISSTKRPIGSFLFLGPTGVGKTETAKALAFSYFGSDEQMIRFDMGEYQTEDALDRALGSLSSKEPGSFVKAIRENPFSLLLIDEVEKANPKLLNLFLTILDEGYFSDTFGRKVDCRNIIIIATSNAGAEFIRQQVEKSAKDTSDGGRMASSEVKGFSKEVVEYVLRQAIFSPEFVNRFDAAIVFKPLTKENLVKIAEQMLKDLNKRLVAKECSVKITPELIAKVADLGYDPAFGARPMRRVIQDKIEDQIAQKLLKGEVGKGEELEIRI